MIRFKESTSMATALFTTPPGVFARRILSSAAAMVSTVAAAAGPLGAVDFHGAAVEPPASSPAPS
jgi:hypothetical protein